MDILLGILIGIGSVASLYASYKWGYKQGQINKTAKQVEIDEVVKRQMELRQEGLNNIMNYNLDVAMNRGLNNE